MYRSLVLREYDSGNPVQAERMTSIFERSESCFGGKAPTSELWQKGEAEIYIRQPVSLDQPANSDWGTSLSQFDYVEAVAQMSVHGHWAI